MVLYTERGPWYAGVRPDPRFTQLLKKIGLKGLASFSSALAEHNS